MTWGRSLIGSVLLLTIVGCSHQRAVAGGGATGLPAVKPEAVGLSASALGQIAPAMQRYVDSAAYPGFVMVVARRGRVAYFESVGYMDVENSTQMRTDAIFRIASMRKPIIAAAAMSLVDQGKLGLNDPVSRYIPAFANVQVYAGGSIEDPRLAAPARPMTILHLLTHTSGIALDWLDHPADLIYRREKLNIQNVNLTLEELANRVAKAPLEYSPGDAWHYSLSFDVLARVIEIVSGKRVDVYLREAIFQPLGMHQTTLQVTPEIEGRVPVLHTRADGRLKAHARVPEALYQPQGRLLAGMLSAPRDYLRFAQMLLNGGELEGVRILSRASTEVLLRNQLSPGLVPIKTLGFDHEGYGFGLGGAVLVDPGASYLPGSDGIYRWAGSAGTFFWIDPRAELIGMIWTQMRSAEYTAEHAFQRLVYDALLPASRR